MSRIGYELDLVLKFSLCHFFPIYHNWGRSVKNALFYFTNDTQVFYFAFRLRICVLIVSFGEHIEIELVFDSFSVENSARPCSYNLSIIAQIKVGRPYETTVSFLISEASFVVQHSLTPKIGVILVCDLLEDPVFGIGLLLMRDHAWIQIVFHEFFNAPKLYMIKD